jgi:hypothetical protein
MDLMNECSFSKLFYQSFAKRQGTHLKEFFSIRMEKQHLISS